MRKLVSVMLAMAFVVSLFSAEAALAGGKRKEGTVKAVDEKAGTATFMFEGEDKDVTLAVEPDDLKGIKEGDKVKVSFDDTACTIISRVKKVRDITIPVGC